MKLSRSRNRSCGLRLNDLRAIGFFGRLRSTPSSLRVGGGTEKSRQRNGRAVKIVFVPGRGRIALRAQVRRNLFQRRGTHAGVLQLAILHALDPWLDSRVSDWSSQVFLLQGLE
jgi:hypothetical protein